MNKQVLEQEIVAHKRKLEEALLKIQEGGDKIRIMTADINHIKEEITTLEKSVAAEQGVISALGFVISTNGGETSEESKSTQPRPEQS